MPTSWIVLGASPSLSDVWSRRLLRQLAQPPCHQTFRTDDPCGDGFVRAWRAVGLVLRRSDAGGRYGASREVLAVVRKTLFERQEMKPWPTWTCSGSHFPRSTTSTSPRWPSSAHGGYCAMESTCLRLGITNINSSSSSAVRWRLSS